MGRHYTSKNERHKFSTILFIYYFIFIYYIFFHITVFQNFHNSLHIYLHLELIFHFFFFCLITHTQRDVTLYDSVVKFHSLLISLTAKMRQKLIFYVEFMKSSILCVVFEVFTNVFGRFSLFLVLVFTFKSLPSFTEIFDS